jgi:molybdopterin-guanine dinucleotide biosynthesis protein B
MKTVPVICIVGRSKSTQMILMEKLIRELKDRGHQVGTIEHRVDPVFEMDELGKNAWRYTQAGSDHATIAAPDKVVSIREVECEPGLQELVAGMSDVDVILAEGYLHNEQHQIEVARAAHSTEPLCTTDVLLAVATDMPVNSEVPCFVLDDAAAIADLIEGLIG